MSDPPVVLLCGRPDLLTKPGGDTGQILSLLRSMGDAARLSLSLRPRLGRARVVHVFNLSRPVEPALQAQHARRAGLPVVCTPIYQDLEAYNRRGRVGLGRAVFAALGRDDARLEDARALVNLSRTGAAELARRPGLSLGLATHALTGRGAAGHSTLELQRQLLAESQAVVFNSALEAQRVGRRLGLDPAQLRGEVVPVEVDPQELLAADAAPFVRRFGLQRFVLCVGRLEDLKNQLGLVRALDRVPLPLVLIGGVNPRHRWYIRQLRKAVARRPRTLLLTDQPRAMVLSALAAAAVHVLPSWFETAGLVSLEAAVTRCAVVSTDQGYAEAYLGQDAWYCDPADPGSMRAAVQQAAAGGPSEPLRSRVLTRYTVARGATAMTDIYRAVIDRWT